MLGWTSAPPGRARVDVGLEVKWLEGSNEVLPKGSSLSISRASGARAATSQCGAPPERRMRRAVVGTAGLEIYLGPRLGRRRHHRGNGLGNVSSAGEYVTASISGYWNPGLPRLVARGLASASRTRPARASHVSLLRSASGRSPSSRTSVAHPRPPRRARVFVRARRGARRRDPRAARARQEGDVQPRGRLAHARSTSARTPTDRRSTPAATFRYAGLSTQYFYLARLLDKLGVKTDFVRVSPHKTRARAVHATKRARSRAALTTRICSARTRPSSRRTSPPGATRHGASARRGRCGIALPPRRRRRGLRRQLAFDDEVERATQEMDGRRSPYEPYQDEVHPRERFGPRDKVAVLYVDGDIVDGRSSHIPLIDMKLAGSTDRRTR